MTSRAHLAAGGMVAVVEERLTGFGPTVWYGELRDQHDQPVQDTGPRLVVRGHRVVTGVATCYPVAVGRTEQEVLGALRDRALTLVGGA